MIDFISSMESNVQVLTLDNAGATRAKVQENVTRSYDYTAAIHDMKRAAELSPEFPYTYYNLGNLYCLSNDLPESIIQYSKAIELFPHIGEAYYNRGLVQIYLQDKEKGCMDMSKAGELGISEAYSVIKKYCTVEGK
jgi:tetratricopeptide (TPR) repeat protein